MNYSLSKKKAKELVEAKLSHFMGVSPEEATDEQYYKAIALIVRDMMSQGRTEFSEKAAKAGTKKVYYLCMEFLMGRSLKNNLYNLNLTDVFASVLADYGVKLETLMSANRTQDSATAASADLPPAILTRSQPTDTLQEDIPYFMNAEFSSRSLLTAGRPSFRTFGFRAAKFGLSPTKRAHLRFALRAT